MRNALESGKALVDKVLQFESLNQVGVPDEALVHDVQVGSFAHQGLDLRHTFLEQLRRAVHGSVLLHGLLQLVAQLSGADGSLLVANLVQALDGVEAGVAKRLVRGARGCDFGNTVGAGAAEDNNIQKGVGTETVGTVDGSAGCLTSGEQTLHNAVLIRATVQRVQLDQARTTQNTTPLSLSSVQKNKKANYRPVLPWSG